MSAEQNKALVQRWFDEFINKNNMALAEALIDPNYVNHFLPLEAGKGPQAEKQIMVMFFSAFPDLRGRLKISLAREIAL